MFSVTEVGAATLNCAEQGFLDVPNSESALGIS